MTIREWRNSFVPINRVPLEVLSLIPTHLSCEEDLLCATSVCRHWRRTFIQHATLWSQVNLTIKKSGIVVKTLLERAKGSPLDVRSARLDCAEILALLSRHTQQFRTLDFFDDYWPNIRMFSEAMPGPFPLLRTLKIRASELEMLGPETTNPPSLPLFSGAVNLKEFILHSAGIPHLNHFAFPNLTTFELFAAEESEEFPVSQLLNFLEASQTLRTVRIEIAAETYTEDVPLERVIVLPNAEVFSVTQDKPGYRIAAHVTCPSARLTSLIYEYCAEEETPQLFPTSVSWNVIGPQYMSSTIDEVILRITIAEDDILSCFLSFLSPGLATLRLGCIMVTESEDSGGTPYSLGEKHSQVFSQASKAIREHPLLSNVKRLHIQDRHNLLAHQLEGIAEQAAQLFKFVGPLEELVLDVDNLRPFFSPSSDLVQPGEFSLIKVLTIERSEKPLKEECMAAIVELVKSRHALGVPFERVVFCVEDYPVGMIERLKPWAATLYPGGMIEDDEDFI